MRDKAGEKQGCRCKPVLHFLLLGGVDKWRWRLQHCDRQTRFHDHEFVDREAVDVPWWQPGSDAVPLGDHLDTVGPQLVRNGAHEIRLDVGLLGILALEVRADMLADDGHQEVGDLLGAHMAPIDYNMVPHHHALPLCSGWPSNRAIISFISTTMSSRSALEM